MRLPESLAEIGVRAFYKSGIQRILIPKRVKSIADQAFACAESLSSVEFEPGSALTEAGV